MVSQAQRKSQILQIVSCMVSFVHSPKARKDFQLIFLIHRRLHSGGGKCIHSGRLVNPADFLPHTVCCWICSKRFWPSRYALCRCCWLSDLCCWVVVSNLTSIVMFTISSVPSNRIYDRTGQEVVSIKTHWDCFYRSPATRISNHRCVATYPLWCRIRCRRRLLVVCRR